VTFVRHKPLEQDHRTGPCPEGHGLFASRARVTNEDPFFFSSAARAPAAAFGSTRGEWSRLADAKLLADVTNLWKPGLARAPFRRAKIARRSKRIYAKNWVMRPSSSSKNWPESLSEQSLGRASAGVFCEKRLRER